MKRPLLFFATLMIITFITTGALAQTRITGPLTVIYKTRKDYRHHVPVILSDDKTRIVSFPAPGDLKHGNTYTIPTKLHNGYLLDNRGINQNVAFLKWTYEEYAALKKTPSAAELYRAIADKNPLTDLYICGPRHDPKNSVQQLNILIDKKQLPNNCKTMK
jgi:hypothetical protein